MQIHENGNRFYNYYKWENKKHCPYDYAKQGLLKNLISSKIVESKNSFLQTILSFVERCLAYMLKSVDYVKNFHNYNWKN
jgi:hypothetical protein